MKKTGIAFDNDTGKPSHSSFRFGTDRGRLETKQ
jgi:hypothetical protein